MKRWSFLALALTLLLLTGATQVFAKTPSKTPYTPFLSGSATIYVQVMDSCKEALPGAYMTLVNPDSSTVNAGPSAGTKRVTVNGASTCPEQRGSCVTTSTGCLTFTIPIPSTAQTYQIKENPTYDSSDGMYENPPGASGFTGFVPCTGGSACPGAFDLAKVQTATFTLNPDGSVTNATTLNIYPDNKTATYPTAGGVVGSFAATQADPIVFHNFQLGNLNCDSDTDVDDHLTGGTGAHCDNDADPPLKKK